MNKPRLYIPFAVQICVISICMLSMTAGYFGYKSYLSEAARKEESLANELIAIVRTASTQLNIDDHEEIFFDLDDGLEGQDEFNLIRDVLVNIRDLNKLEHGKGSPVYTLRKAFDFDESNNVEFVVMSDVNEQGRYYTGSALAAEDLHLQAFSGEATVTGVYRDTEGAWISAAAPLIQNGEVVALIQADRTVDFYYDELAALQQQYFVTGAVCVFIGIVFSLFFSHYATRPLKILLYATKVFGEGDYAHKI